MSNLSGPQFGAVKKKLCVMSAAILLGLTAAACGGGGSDPASPPAAGAPPTTPPPAPPPPASQGKSFTISGSGLLGLIFGGTVEAQDPDTGRILATTQTSTTDGTFSLVISADADFDGPFVRFVVRGGSDAVMVCDAPNGCGATVFGQTFPIDETESVSVILATPDEGGIASGSANKLTTLAGALAEAASGGLSAQSIANANSQVADLFGIITSELESIPNINIGDPDVAGSPEAVRVALINAGLLGAIQEAGGDIGTEFDRFVALFVSQNGQVALQENSDDPNFVSLEDILEEATAAATQAGQLADDGDVFIDTRLGLEGQLATVRGAGDGELSNALPSPTAGVSNDEAAKAFVADLQLIVGAVREEEEAANLEAFGERVADAGRTLFTSDATKEALSLTSDGLSALVNAFEAFDLDQTLTSIEIDGFEITIVEGVKDVAVSFAEQIGGTDIELSATILVDELSNTSNSVGSDPVSLFSSMRDLAVEISLVGLVVNQDVRLEIRDGRLSASQVSEVITETDNGGSVVREMQTSRILEVGLLKVELDASLTDPMSVNGLQLDGLISAEALGVIAETGTFSTVRTFSVGQFDPDTGVSTPGDDMLNRFEDDTSSLLANALEASFTGSIREGGNTVDISIFVDVDGNNFRLSDDLPTTPSLRVFNLANDRLSFDYEVEDGILFSFLYSDSLTYDVSLVSAVDAETEIARLLSDGEFVNIVRADDGDTFEDPVVLRYESRSRPDQNTQFSNILFGDRRGMAQAFDLADVDAAVANAPLDDAITYVNAIFIDQIDYVSRLFCTGFQAQDLILFRPQRFPMGEGTSESPLIESVGTCSSSNPRIDEVFVTAGNDFNLDDDASAAGDFAASIRQDIIGIDANDSIVELSAFGSAAFANGTLTGEASIQLSFGGRRFATDARGFDALNDPGERPIIIRNQDGVTLTVSEGADGQLSGNITVDGVEEAVISDLIDGLLFVTFNDGSFVSIL